MNNQELINLDMDELLQMPEVQIRNNFKRELDIRIFSKIDKVKNQKPFWLHMALFTRKHAFKSALVFTVFLLLIINFRPVGVGQWTGFGVLPAASSTLDNGVIPNESNVNWQIENNLYFPSAIKVFKIDNTGKHEIKINNQFIDDQEDNQLTVNRLENNGVSFTINQPQNRYEFNFSITNQPVTDVRSVNELINNFWQENNFMIDSIVQPNVKRLPLASENPVMVRHELVEFPWQVNNMMVFSDIGLPQSMLTLEVENNEVVKGDSLLNTNYLESLYPLVSLAEAQQRLLKTPLPESCVNKLIEPSQAKINVADVKLAYMEKKNNKEVYLLPVYVFTAQVSDSINTVECNYWVDAVVDDHLVN